MAADTSYPSRSLPSDAAGAAPRDALRFAGGDVAVSLERRAYDAILEWLIRGQGVPGQPIPLREFARALGMSRTPLRTALGRLQEQGLVDYSARLGFTAAVPSVADLNQMFEIRAMCETFVVRRFFERSNQPDAIPAEIPQLAQRTWDIVKGEVITEEMARAFWETDSRLHRAIVTLGHNRKLVEWWDLLHINLHIARAGLRGRMTSERFQVSAREHLAFAAAMESGDGELAVRLIEAHLTRVREQTIRFVTAPDERDTASALPRLPDTTPVSLNELPADDGHGDRDADR